MCMCISFRFLTILLYLLLLHRSFPAAEVIVPPSAAPHSTEEARDLFSDKFLLECFHLINRSNDESLQIKEVTAAFDIIKSDLEVFNNLDEDHDGSISSREFQRGVQALPRTPALVKQLRKWADDIESERIAERLAKDK